MKRLLLMVAVLALFVLSGCLAESDLKVYNRSAGYVNVWLANSYQKQSIAPHSFAYLSIPAVQTSQIMFQGDHILPGSIFIESEGSGTKSLELEANCGALRFINGSTREVRELAISEAGMNQWSENKLRFGLLMGEDEIISLLPGLWDLRIRDHFNNIHYVTAQRIELDKTKTYNFLSVR